MLWDPTEDERRGRLAPEPLETGSVRELQAWIDKHVRFDHAAADPMLFPGTVQTVAQAREAKEKIV
jgi:hypothetical protein